MALPARRGRAAQRPRLGPLHHRAGPRQLARQAHALSSLRFGHHGPARRLGAPLHERRDRALPAHRPGGDHGRRRRRRPAAAGPRAAVGRGPLLGARRLRRARGVPRGGRGTRGARGGGRGGRGRPLPRQPAVALSVLPHGGVHRDGQGHDVPSRRGRDRRGDLGLPRGAGEGGRGRPDRDLPAALDRPPADRALVRRRDRPAGRVDRPRTGRPSRRADDGHPRHGVAWRSSGSATWRPWPP